MSKPVVTIAANAVNAKLHEPTREAKMEVQQILSYRVNGAEETVAFKRGGWDGRSSFFTFKSGTFPAGFLHLVSAHLRKRGYDVRIVRKQLPEALGPLRPEIDAFGYVERYDYQPEVVDRLVKHGQIIAQVATGGGKCLGIDTPILMYDGSIKVVQDVVVGDILMGPDSKPRNILSTCKDVGELYRVTPTKGDSYVVNDAHILSLKKTSRGYRGKNRDGEKYPKGEVVNINVEKFLQENKTFRHTHKGWRTGVDFSGDFNLPVAPYLLGLILGDGSISGTVSITTLDEGIKQYVEAEAAKLGLFVNVCSKQKTKAVSLYISGGRNGGKPNPLMVALRALDFKSTDGKAAKKFIPQCYKVACRHSRLEILAGILDTDGYYDGKCLYLTLKEGRLFDDALFIARSLGFAAYKKKVIKTCANNGVSGEYYSMVISGNIHEIPVRLERRKAAPRMQKKDVLVTGLKVEAIGRGNYYGFEIDGDHLFMLGDFTVTHNTRIARMAFARIGRPTLFLTTRSILMYQMKETFEQDLGINCSVLGDGQFGHINAAGKTCVKKMSVGMVQTLISRLEETTLQREFDALYDSATKKLTTATNAKRKELMEVANMTPTLLKRKMAEFVDAGNKLIERQAAAMKKKATARLEEKEKIRLQTIGLLAMFEFVILEEAHEASGSSYYEILKHCKNAHYRLAMTGTPFMKDDEESNMRLMACSGPIAIKVSEKTLIDRGILAKPYFKFVQLETRPMQLHRATGWQAAYRIGIVQNQERNRAVVHEVIKAKRYGLTAMILVQQTAHGEVLRELLTEAGLNATFIRGENNQVERKDALNKLITGETDALIGTTILDVGVDVPAVGMIILAGGGKAEVALRQRIGRGLRAKKTGPNAAFVVDFSDQFNDYTRDHAKQRHGIIRDTEGFGENIITSTDFEYEKLGFAMIKS